MSQSLARRTSLSKQEEYERKQLTDRIIRVLTNTPIPVSKRGIVEGLTKGQKSKLGKLTLEDFELIRENTRVKNIMANILEIDVTRLQEIVTVAKGHKKQIESSSKNKRLAKSLSLRSLKDVVPTFLKEIPATARPARPATARPARAPLIDMINPDIMGIIMGHVKKSLEYKLRDWIPKEKLVKYALSKNYNAIDYLVKNKEEIDYRGLSANTNPKALDLLRQQIAINPYSIDWDALSKNPIAMPLLLENKTRIVWKAFCSNPHPYTITLLKNTMMEDFDNRHIYLDWSSLSSNTSYEAIAFLFLPENIHNIDWKVLSDNTNPEAIKLLTEKANDANEGRDELNWFAICRNENAIDIILDALQNYALYIRWSTLVNNTNPKVINIIKNILNLSDDDITKQQIRWFELSPNPSAIYILLKNQDKIMWTTFCGNTMIKHPKALKLLEEKIEEENKQGRKGGNNITWSVLSANPSIFILS
jgi:hypothetical protein